MTVIDLSPSPRRSRRRAIVFCCSFIPVLIASLTYVYLRPPVYRAVARVRIAPAAAVTQPAETQHTPTLTTDAKSFLTEVQVLTSRPLLQNVLERLKGDGPLPEFGPDPLDAMQQMLHVEPIPGTQLVELVAEGPQQQFVPRLTNSVIDAYRQHIAEAYKAHAFATYDDLNKEISELKNTVAQRRQEVDAFRARYDIVSIEHKENDVLTQIERLSQSYTEANSELAKAQAYFQSLKAAAVAGKGVVKAKDDPTLADLERRVSVLREQWRDLQRRYTSNYLAIDPSATALRARLEDLEQQLKTQHATSVQTALAEAEEKVSAAQAAADRLLRDVAANQQKAQEFTTHLDEYKALQADLDHFESMHRAALDRLTKLQASERERAPQVELLEAAVPSREPSRPNYRLDALIAGVGSFAFGLFAIWFTEIIAGPPPSTGILVQHAWVPAMLGGTKTIPSLPPAIANVAQLPAPEPLPRELVDAEIAALMNAATKDARLAVIALLMGLAEEELAALRWDDIDLASDDVRVRGEATRSMPLMEPLRGLLADHRPADADPAVVLRNSQGRPLELADIDRLVLYTAYDAGLDRPEEATPAALRYTYLCYLVRQGIRAADISIAMGHVPQQQLIACMQIHAPRERCAFELIDRVLPVLRGFPGAPPPRTI
jgi:polysaccharide biosynthesis transport protein